MTISRFNDGLVAFGILLVSAAPVARASAQQDPRPGPEPPAAAAAWKPLIGDYGSPADSNPLVVFERGGVLLVSKKGSEPEALAQTGPGMYAVRGAAPAPVLHARGASGPTIAVGDVSLSRRDYVATTGSFVVHPPRPV